MITERLNALKTKGNFSWQELSDLTGIPVATIRKTFSGETANPSYDVVDKLLTAMGGAVVALEEKRAPGAEWSEEDMQAVMEQMKVLYEARIADLWRMIDKLTEERKTLFITMIALVGIMVSFIVYLFVDGMHGNWGFFQY